MRFLELNQNDRSCVLLMIRNSLILRCRRKDRDIWMSMGMRMMRYLKEEANKKTMMTMSMKQTKRRMMKIMMVLHLIIVMQMKNLKRAHLFRKLV